MNEVIILIDDMQEQLYKGSLQLYVTIIIESKKPIVFGQQCLLIFI